MSLIWRTNVRINSADSPACNQNEKWFYLYLKYCKQNYYIFPTSVQDKDYTLYYIQQWSRDFLSHIKKKTSCVLFNNKI